ncbi:MAG: rod shape-determining protein MreC [Rickettsiales bacterium]|nr:rod shape-determining protein MreC [Rickettsiales bacterium]
MDHYSNFTQSSANYSFKHSFDLVFNKIETVLFSFLCVIFLVISKVNADFSEKISFGFVGISMPVVKTIALPFNATINLLTSFSELVDAKEENAELKEELAKLKSFYVKSLNIHQENKELRSILDFVTAKTSSFKVARVIGRAHQVFNQKVFIDAGANRGLQEGAIVSGVRGVIGRIAEVGEDKSRLILLNDASSRIPVVTSKSRDRAILAGNNGGLMEMLYLSKNHKIETGDWVFTSGDGDTLPPGLLVGVVKKVDGESVLIAMVEDLTNADIVTIISY